MTVPLWHVSHQRPCRRIISGALIHIPLLFIHYHSNFRFPLTDPLQEARRFFSAKTQPSTIEMNIDFPLSSFTKHIPAPLMSQQKNPTRVTICERDIPTPKQLLILILGILRDLQSTPITYSRMDRSKNKYLGVQRPSWFLEIRRVQGRDHQWSLQ